MAEKRARLLAGGNPQIAKAEGEEAVRAYIEAMPDWKHGVGERLDALVAQVVPGVRRAVKWNSPFYGVPGQEGWFLSFHCFAKYVKVAFFQGKLMTPMPPVESKSGDVRYLHVGEDRVVDEAQFLEWVRKAAELPAHRL